MYTNITFQLSRLLFVPKSLALPANLPDPIYSGDGLEAGLDHAANAGVSDATDPQDIREVIGDIVDTALTYVALIATVVIIIAGLYLIVGLGSDDSRETAKKIILYVAVGILLIILSKAIVNLIIDFGSGTST